MGEVEIKSNARNVSSVLNNALRRALKIIGMKAESYAKLRCPADTGLLRNSITFALGGEAPNIQTYMNDGHDKTGKEVPVVTGTYEGTADNDTGSEMSLYVGTNVKYAPYQEMGHHTVNGGWVPPQEFLRPAMMDHLDEYANVIKTETSKI